jgi:hypothetical protein
MIAGSGFVGAICLVLIRSQTSASSWCKIGLGRFHNEESIIKILLTYNKEK